MDAMLNGMKAIINEFLVYKFELASYTVKDIVPAIRQNNTTFFVLASNGAATAASVKTSLLTSISKIRSAINYLKSETDAQSDDVIKKGNDGVSTADLDTVLTYLNKAENSFTQAINIEVPDADIDGNDYTISVNIGKLFDNPPSNPKLQWLPPYTVDTSAHGDILWHWTQTEYATFAFPDPTLNGILPGMTNDRLKKIMGVEKEFAWQLHVWMNDQGNTLNQSSSFKIVVNGKTYYPAQNSNNYYSSFSRDFEFFVLDNLNYPVQVYAVLNGSDVALTLNKQLVTKGKTHHELNADVTRAPQNMQAFANSYPLRVDLQLNQWGTWRIDRLMGTSGTFSKIDSLMTSYYTDNTVQAKTTYTYRALRYPPNYGWEYLACRPANFTNSVTVTTP
jgi:YHS domain-containing protein